jgi:hypothetical protein
MSEAKKALPNTGLESDAKPEAVDREINTTNFFHDLEAIRLSPEDTAELGTREILIRVPVRRPKREEFFRCHPDPNMKLEVTICTDRDEQEDVYVVAPAMRGVLAEDMRAVLLQLAISRKGTVFIWPLMIPNEDNPLGRSWHDSARKAAELAKSHWIRIAADRSLGGYRVRQAEGKLPEPEWPADKTFSELLTIAFADRIILTEDHPMVRRLRGLV